MERTLNTAAEREAFLAGEHRELGFIAIPSPIPEYFRRRVIDRRAMTLLTPTELDAHLRQRAAEVDEEIKRSTKTVRVWSEQRNCFVEMTE